MAAMNPIGLLSTSPVAPTGPTTIAPRAPTPDSGSFSNVIKGLLDNANEPHVQADTAMSDLISGKTDNVHNVVLSAVKADLSFRLMLELRNRLTEAYQEIMRMQV